MATRIKLKSSVTPQAVPTTSNIEDREVALNIADQKLYVNDNGTIVEVANAEPNPASVTTAMLATDITNGPGQTWFVALNGTDVTTLGGGGANGKHPDTPFLTVAKALSVAQSGDSIEISAGTYVETFPLVVPDGVHVRGSGIRQTEIKPTGGTNDLNAFVLNGDTTIEDLTVRDFFYNSTNDTGYGFVCANNWNSSRSAYIQRVTILNKGSVVTGSDPYGFQQGDAGRGAKLDGSIASSANIEAAVLFNECTFIVPNSIGLYLTNGIRVEWLNGFIYFADEGIKGVQGATGVYGTGRTRLRLSGTSGTFSAGESIYQLEDQFQSGTYSRSGTTVTVSRNAHGLVQNDRIYADFISGAATDGFYQITSATTNTFTFSTGASGTTSGNVTYKKAEGYGLITLNDGNYLYLSGKGEGQFTTTVEGGKTAVPNADAQVDNSIKQFGTGSLLLDGTGDYVNYASEADFGFGTANFCVETWIYPNSLAGTQTLLDFRGSAADTAPTLRLNGGTVEYAVGGTTQISGGSLTTGNWVHVAVARFNGVTKLFVAGNQVGSNYTDTNNYGAEKGLKLGADYSNAGNYAGHFDEIRLSKGTARFTGNFTPPSVEYGTDIFTVLLLHFNANDGSTIFVDSGSAIKDIRSDGGDSATGIALVDYNQFGAELRSIASANVYGNKGVVAEGNGVKLLLTAHNFAYIGAGQDFTNDGSLAAQSNEVIELNGGRVFYSSTDQKGDFRVGSVFIVDQETGNVNFSSTSTSQEAASITLSDATGTTNIFPAYIETGNLRLAGNTVSTTSGDIIFDPAGNQDVVYNAEAIFTEAVYFDQPKAANFKTDVPGNLGFYEGQSQRRGGFNGYGVQSDTNLYLSKEIVATVNVDTAGDGYAGGATTVNADTNPPVVCTATLSLDLQDGSLKTATVTAGGDNYVSAPTVSFSAPQDPQGSAPSVTAVLYSYGDVQAITVDDGGEGYTAAPGLVVDAPGNFSFDTETEIVSNAIVLANHPMRNGTRVIYNQNSGSQNIGLSDGTLYYVVNVVSDPLTGAGVSFQVSATQGGGAISLTPSTAGNGEAHLFDGVQATATATVSGGAITNVTINEPGSLYDRGAGVAVQEDGSQSPTTAATLTLYVGSPVASFLINSRGDGYNAAPTISFTNAAIDSYGFGAAATSTIGFPLAQIEDNGIVVTNPGAGYAFAPQYQLSGGSPVTEAVLTPILNKKKGNISSIDITGFGVCYSSAPTVTFYGGAGNDGRFTINVQSVTGNITNGGSGYVAGEYADVELEYVSGGAGAPSSNATATFTVNGWTGNITNAGSGYIDGQYDGHVMYNVPAATYTVTVISNPGTPPPDNVYQINGVTQQSLTFVEGNTYRFDLSDASNSGHPLSVGREDGGTLSTDIAAVSYGTAGTDGAFVDIIVKPGTAGEVADYICTNHANMGSGITITTGTAGNYGTGLSADVTISGGQITEIKSDGQGVDYAVGDTVSVNPFAIDTSGVGTGFVWTLAANDTTISDVSNISLTGGPYEVGMVLSVDNQNVGGSGSNFTYTVSNAGFVRDVEVVQGSEGYGYTAGEVLYPRINPETDGNTFQISVGSTTTTAVWELTHDGSIVNPAFKVAGAKDPTYEPGTLSLGAGVPKIVMETEYGHITTDGNLTVKGNLTLGDNAAVDTITVAASTTATGDTDQTGDFTLTGDMTVDGIFTQSGGASFLEELTGTIADGSAAAPSLALNTSPTTGMFWADTDIIGVANAGVETGRIGPSAYAVGTRFQVGTTAQTASPLLDVNPTTNLVRIGSSATGLSISSTGLIEGNGTASDIGITLQPKGTGNVTIVGGTDKDFVLNDGTSTELFKVDLDSGNAEVAGHLTFGGRFRIDDFTLSNQSLALSSFGELVSLDTSGTATLFNDGSYTNVNITATGTGKGTGGQVDVVVTGGTITSVTTALAGSRGRDYVAGDTITIDPAVIGTDASQTVTITDVSGSGIDIKPQNRRNVRVDGTGTFIVPVGSTNDRPYSDDLYVGGIRYNTTTSQFEGYNGIDFVSLGGVRDVDQDTYILTEVTPGSDEDTFQFYNAGINSLSIDQNRFTLKSTRTIDVEGTLSINGTTGLDTLDVQRKGTSVVKVRTTKDLEITGGLYIKNQLAAGTVATFNDGSLGASAGSFNSAGNVYSASQTFSAIGGISEFAGSGAAFNVITNASGGITSITISTGGINYEIGEIITIPGGLLGGAVGTDVTFTVATISNPDTAHGKISAIQSELRFNLNGDKQFLNLDSNQADARLKVNRAYATGGVDYLTVLDSTASFVELNDARVEGGEITSFSTTVTITQFEKTQYKGAKTLITLESDDGKVHMFEVTTVCAASGTVAHATVTNSITSDNDLMDASVSVAGNNVQISLAKSSQATSSSTFTGRFTTTKVKV